MIRLEEINETNWREGPLRVKPEQQKYVADATTILARAYAYRHHNSRAVMIYDDETPVGMGLYHDDPQMEAYIFSELLIDARYQGRGFGCEATRLMLDEMRSAGRYNKVVLCYIEGNEGAKRLYEKFGFQVIDQDEDEIIMQAELSAI